jgi:hypothetical protein
MAMSTDLQQSGAETFVERLTELGINILFANAGTDFPPIVEAISKLSATGAKSIRSLHAMGSGIFLAILRSRVIRRFHFRWSPRRLAGAKSTKTKSSSVAAA